MFPRRKPLVFAAILVLILVIQPLIAMEPTWNTSVQGERLTDLAIAADGSRVITGSSMGNARVFDGNGSLLWKAQVPGSLLVECLRNGSGYVLATREVLATNKGAVRYYDRNGSLLWIYHSGWVTGTCISDQEGRLVAGNRVGDILVLDETGTRVALFNDFPKMYVVAGPALSQNGKVLAYTLHERNPQIRYVRIDRNSKVTFRSFSKKADNSVYVDDEPITRLVLSADGAYLATVGGEGSHGLLCLYAGNGTKIWSRDMERILDIQIEGDGSLLYVGTEEGNITSFLRNGSRSWTFQAGSQVQGIALSGEAGLLAGGTRKGDLFLLNRAGDLVDHSRIEEFPTGSISLVTLSRDGRSLAAVANEKNLYCFMVSGSSSGQPVSLNNPVGKQPKSTPVLFPFIRSYQYSNIREGISSMGRPVLWNLSDNLKIPGTFS